ncbi:thiolase family protein [Alcaligenaceae bacterium]|nr:thiolase family protein [Alcaligenaceae bacterium]
MSNVFITAMARTPFGKFRGMLAGLDSIDLGTALMDELIRRDPAVGAVDTVFGGSGLLGGSYLTSLRQMLVRSSLPNNTVSVAVDRACCTGMTAISTAAAYLKSGGGVKAMVAGVESLSNMPVLLSRGNDRRIASLIASDPLLLAGRVSPKTIAEYTSEEALKYGVSREMQDDWAHASHEKHFAGLACNLHEGLLFSPGPGLTGPLLDEGPRAGADRAKLATLRTVNNSSTITAGNAPGLSDGAAGMILMEGDAMRASGIEPMAEVLDWVQVAGEIQEGTSVPYVALLRLLERNNLALDDIAVIEINEAFAATPLVSTRLLGEALSRRPEAIQAKTNIYGGSVAVGHPLGASGVRVVMQAASILRQRGGGLALCAICGGFGQGEAVLIKV